MSLGLLLPIGLAALAALLLPLLLHLDRQSESRPTDFAALRWLSARLRPRRRLRLEELPLLLLRLLLVASVALLFARPVLFGAQGGEPRVLVAPGVDLADARAKVSLPEARWQWLATGFPPIESAPPSGQQPLASLLREIDASLPVKTPVTVIVPEQVGGLDGERPRLARRVDWRTVRGDGKPAAKPAADVATAAPPKLFVRHSADRAASVRYLRAAAIAWRTSATSGSAATAESRSIEAAAEVVDEGPASQPIPADARWLAWLAPGELPPTIRAWIENGGVALLDERAVLPAGVQVVGTWREADGELLASSAAMGKGRVVILSRALLPETFASLLAPEFPAGLRAALEPAPAPPQRAYSQALRPLPGGPRFPEVPRPVDSWLALLAAALFALERWFASSARRGRAP